MENGILLFQCAMVRTTDEYPFEEFAFELLHRSACNNFKVLVEYSSLHHVKNTACGIEPPRTSNYSFFNVRTIDFGLVLQQGPPV